MLDRFLYDNNQTVLPWLAHENYKFFWGDFCDRKLVSKVLDGVTDVLLLAGLVGDPITKAYPDQSKLINENAYIKFLSVIKGRKLNRVVFVSTCSNYGLVKGDQLANEEFQLNPLSSYAKAKVRIEQELLNNQGNADYTATILRFATAFGLSPRMRFDLTISEFVRELWEGRELLVYDPDTWRPYCHVKDFANIVQLVLEAPKSDIDFEVFNAGSDNNNYTKRMIVQNIEKLVPDVRIRFQKEGTDPRNYRVNFAKLRTRLDFKPSHTVVDGIQELVDALEAHIFDNIENKRNFHGNYEISYS